MQPGGGMLPGMMMPGALPGMMPGATRLPGARPSGDMRRPGLPAGVRPTSARGQPEPETVEAGNYVILTLNGEAYQFTPLMTKYRDKLENRATPAAPAPAPAGRPATPTGAR
jgi:hypothetical protein